MNEKFLIAGLLLLIGLAIEIGMQAISGISLALAWAALFAAAFFVNIGELLLLVIFAAGMLNWLPASSFILALFILAPLAAFGIRQSLQLKPFFGMLCSLVVSMIALYGTFGFDFVLSRPGIAALDLVASLAFGVVAFLLLDVALPRYV